MSAFVWALAGWAAMIGLAVAGLIVKDRIKRRRLAREDDSDPWWGLM